MFVERDWLVNEKMDNIVDDHFSGLWETCAFDRVKEKLTCDAYNYSIFNSGFPSWVLVARLFLSLGILLGIIATVVFLLGTDYTTVFPNGRKKKNIKRIGGILVILAAACTLFVGIWVFIYVWRHYQDKWSTFTRGHEDDRNGKKIAGVATYTCLIGGLFWFIIGCVGLCCSSTSDDEYYDEGVEMY